MRKMLGFTAIALIAVGGCTGARPGDRERLLEMEREFGGRYSFRMEEGLYLRAKAEKADSISPAEAERIYERFFTDGDGQRRETTFVYLNLYDAKGEFAYQLSFDRQSGAMERSKAEHY